MKINPLLLCDMYKVDHIRQYPQGTQYVYSNLTPRKSRLKGVEGMVFFGLQYFIKEVLIRRFEEDFFGKTKDAVIASYARRVKGALGADLPSYDHIGDLHDLGYLPLKIKALPEGTVCPMRVPCLTIVNTDPRFYWLTNFIETILSAELWQACTSATIAHEYRKLLDRWANMTGMPPEFVQWQGHDFSFRGMSSLESAILSGMGHLLSFTGTDTIPAIDAMEQYYRANADTELIGGSVAATEHSVMCAGGKESEIATFERLVTEIYPSGIVSIVSDTWDLWQVCTEFLPALKERIMARDGKVVIRPDSGDPVKIICGDPDSLNPHARAGVVELLWNVFGGTENAKGYKVLESHIGAIYGDSITLERADTICRQLEKKGFASQVVFGIGSYTYQYNTRDTFGTAMKATYVQINGESVNIFKSPVTDDGTKVSAKGLLHVGVKNDVIALTDQVDELTEDTGLLELVYEDGKLLRNNSLKQVREMLRLQREGVFD